MESSRPLYLRTHGGLSLGPLEAGQVRALVAQGKVEGPVLVSEDGVTFAPPGQFLHLRELFPPELWGEAEGPIREGDLGTTSAVRAYARAAASEATGTLELELPDRKIQIAFRRGNPVAVESTHTEDALEAYLLSHGVDPTKVSQASMTKAQFGGDLLAALFGQGLANPATLVPLLSQRALQIALKAMLATQGWFRFHDGAGPQQAMPLGSRWAVLVDLVRRIPTVELRRRLADVRERAPMRSGGKVSPDELRLTPKELRALSNLDGVRTLEQVVQQNPADEEHLLRLVFLLRELDAIGFSAAAAPQPGARAVPAGGSAGASAPPGGQRPPAPGSRPSPTRGPPPTLHAAGGPPTLHAAGAPPAIHAAAGHAVPGAPPTLNAAAGHAAPGAPPTLHASAGAAPASRAAAGAPVRPAVPSASAPASAPPRLTPAATAAARPPAPQTPARAQASAPASPAARVPTPEPQAAAPNFAAEITDLRARLEKTRTMNAFDLLGVTEKTDSAAVKVAYFKLAKQLHPDTVPPGAPAELAKLKESLFASVGEAYRRIGDDKNRAAYVEELKSGGSDVDVSRILQAEDQFYRSTVLVKARRFAEAAKLLDTAILNNPEEGEYYAWRGYARFFGLSDKNEARVLASNDLNEALKKNPKCVAAYYYLGQIAKLSNDPSAALKHFKKTVELDPNHIDAQRELRILGKK